MKTKMKTIMSVCVLTVLLYACTKDSATPEPVYDCMRIENGLAILDDCGTCHQSYVYDMYTHMPTYIDDTTDLELGPTEMLVLAGSPQDIASNKNWNGGPLAAIDSCGDCHQSYIYNDSTHVQTDINDTTGLVLGANEMVILAGSALDMMFNPNWNGGPLAAIDSCGDCHQSYIYNDSTHVQTDINDTTGLVLGANEMVILAGSALDIMFNPNWNTGCK